MFYISYGSLHSIGLQLFCTQLLNNTDLYGKKLSRSYYVTSLYDEDDTICAEIKALYARHNVLLPKLGHCTHDVKKNLLIH